jgi:hypothetical protein
MEAKKSQSDQRPLPREAAMQRVAARTGGDLQSESVAVFGVSGQV